MRLSILRAAEEGASLLQIPADHAAFGAIALVLVFGPHVG